MYMVFTEEQGKSIRDRFKMTVIEYKNYIKKGFTPGMISAVHELRKAINFIIDAGRHAAQALYDCMDSLKMLFEDIRDKCGYCTSRRYKFVKFLSKVGFNKMDMWVATRHTWLARSDC